MKYIKSMLSILVAFSLLTISSVEVASKVNTVGINVDVPSETQIKQFIKSHPILAGTNNNVTYETIPSTKKPYSAGKVSAKYLIDGLNSVNIIRYIAGIPADVELDEDYNYLDQAGSVVNAANGSLDHTPTKPAGMEDDLYNDGYSGTSQSNISFGHRLISDSVIYGYMEDGDSGNIQVIGHRRWILNPPMQKTGFGFTPDKFSAMFTMDNVFQKFDDMYSVTAWPAQNMPVEYFGKIYPFSVSLSEDFDNLDINNISIKMTRLSDGKVFNFNNSTSNNTNSQTYFNVDNTGYGQPHCIIWRPNVTGYKSGDVFSIQIFGVKKFGEDYPISYNASFFSLKNSNAIPKISNLSLSSNILNAGNDTVKVYVNTDMESSLYCKVYDQNNNKVATIANGAKLKNSGRWYVTWKGTNSNGEYLAPGTYKIYAYLNNSSGNSKTLSTNITIK